MTYVQGHVEPWWDDSFKKLDYQYIAIKNTYDQERWVAEGYKNVSLNGALYSMPRPMPDYSARFLEIFDWDNQGIAFFRMNTLDFFPKHQDHYISYKKMFNITDPSVIWRCIVFLEDWKSGHYLEVANEPILGWKRGDYVAWNYDVPHFAANIGLESRYTAQITGMERR